MIWSSWAVSRSIAGGGLAAAAGGVERRLALRQRRADRRRHLHRIAVAADVHVERQGRAAQHVIVDRGDLEAALDQLGHDRIDLGLEQHEIAHHHRAAVHRLERDPAAERECRPDGDAVERHLQVGARKAVAMDVAGYGGGPAQRFVDLLPVDLLGAGGGAHGRHGTNCEHLYGTHVYLLLN